MFETEPEGAKVAQAVIVLARALEERLNRSAELLVAADEAHAVELTDDAGLRAKRDEAAEALRAMLVALRDGLVGLYGASTPGAVGLAGPTPTDPVVLVRVAREVAKGLRQPGVLPPPRYAGAKIDVLAEAAGLEALAGHLEVAIEAVASDLRENQVTKTARDGAMSRHDRVYSRVANVLSALFDFAGEEELADRIRPTLRRPGRLAVEAESLGAAPQGAPFEDEAVEE